MTTPTQSDEELSKKAILWVKANAPDLDMCCYAQEVTETEDGDLCINCRHIFWAAVRGYIAGQQELEAVKRDTLIDFVYYCKLQNEQHGRMKPISFYADEYLQSKQAEGAGK